jgi:hypothetical protein
VRAATIAYGIPEGLTTIGHGEGAAGHAIRLRGPGIAPLHAEMTRTAQGGSALVKVRSVANAPTFVNGRALGAGEEATLQHNDRILFGSNGIFRYVDAGGGDEGAVNWYHAYKEVAERDSRVGAMLGGDRGRTADEDMVKKVPSCAPVYHAIAARAFHAHAFVRVVCHIFVRVLCRVV